jgi:hypothetical protein
MFEENSVMKGLSMVTNMSCMRRNSFNAYSKNLGSATSAAFEAILKTARQRRQGLQVAGYKHSWVSVVDTSASLFCRCLYTDLRRYIIEGCIKSVILGGWIYCRLKETTTRIGCILSIFHYR